MFMATAYQGNKPYIFLSYAHKDKKLANYVVDYLQEYFNVWFDEEIPSGTRWEKVIADKIESPNCWIMVFLATQNSLASDWCKEELRFTKNTGKKFINVVIGSPQFPDWFICDFDEYQRLDEKNFPNRDAMMDKLVEELLHHEMNTDKPTDTPKPSPTEGLEFAITDGTATVTSYKGTDTEVIIPATIIRDGKTYKVTAIGYGAFFYCKNLTSITIPDSVTSIGDLAFFGCENLTSIDVDKNNTHYKSIDGNLYSKDDTTLIQYAIGKTKTSFTIPDSVTSIGDLAFSRCKNLTSITIPNSVTSIEERACAWCENLTSIDVDKNNTHYKSIDGNLYSKDGTTLIQYAIGKIETSFTIPDHVNTIGDFAFAWCENLTSITIPDSVTSIGERALVRCKNITSITIPDSVTSIGEMAFYDCTSLTIYCEAKSMPKGWDSDWNPDNRPVVWNCGSSRPEGDEVCGSSKPSTDSTTTPMPSHTEGLEFSIVDGTARVDRYKGTDTNVIIPATIIRDGKTYKVTSIGYRAFEYCKKLTSITIPNSVTSIGIEAFAGCINLTSITIPNSVTTIGERAFFWCKNPTSITIPDSVTTIGKEAFRSCNNLTSISIPDSVTTIGESAFERCENLTIYCEAKSMPKGWDSDWNPDNRPVVWNCISSSPKEDEVCGRSKPSTDSTTTPKPSHTEGLEFTITDGTARVDRYKGTDTKVIIPATITRDGKTYKVTAIEESAFEDCTSLTSITIPESVTSIGESAFSGCSKLTSISIPNGVTTIGKNAFFWCENLTSITIPNSVTSIGDGAFELCSSLTSIVVDENNQSYKSIDGNLYSRDGTILIKYAIGKTEPSFTIPDHVTSIGEDAFAYCENFTSITIPDGITTIGESAFEGCENITYISIPYSVTTIGEMAFCNCTNLTSITIPDHVTTIGRYAFCNCTNLTSITIPYSVTTVGESAFEGCENLTSITIPDGVTSIGESAFSGCENLTSITIPNSVTSIGINAFEWCDKLTIYCEAKSKPEGWHADWNPDNRPVVWGRKLK